MILDETSSQLFIAVLPIFVASLPKSGQLSEDQVRCSCTASSNVEDQLNIENAIVRLRQEVRELPRCFSHVRSVRDLTKHDHTEASDALEDMLYMMDRRVNDGVRENQTLDEAKRFKRLRALRDLAGDIPWPNLEEEPAVPSEILKWVTYSQNEDSATEAAHYRTIANSAARLNSIMRRLFGSENKFIEPTVTYLMGSSGLSQELEEKEGYREALLGAENLGNFTRKLSDLMGNPLLGPCTSDHATMIHLNGFDKLELAGLDTLITVCGTKKAKKWQAITFLAADPAVEADQSTICEKIRSTHATRPPCRLRVHVGADGLWSSTPERMGTSVRKPNLTLDSALDPKQRPLRLKKKERLDLAIKMARSFFCLIWSPLVSSPWKSSNIYILEQQGGSLTIQPYIESQLHFQDSSPGLRADCKSRRPLIRDFGVLLWELLFNQQIKVTPDDEGGEDSDDEDDDERSDEDPILIALDREREEAAELCFDQTCLDIIEKCIDIYIKVQDESYSAVLQSDIYHYIVQPLWDYVQTYNEGTSALSSRSRVPTPLSTRRRSQTIERTFSSTRSSQAESFSPCLASRTTREIQSPPPMGRIFEKDTLLSSGTVSSSETWLERFDDCKRILQKKGHLSFPVKIAILDTGCDIENYFFAGPGNGFTDAIEANWVDYVEGKRLPCDEDTGKHGTALLALLLRLSPSPKNILVVRIARNSVDLENSEENTAKAISKAVVWGADIISMSFGYRFQSPSIAKAMAEAERRRDGRIIFFAASNNDGLNDWELFPAWMENVISVRGTNCYGSFNQKYNPPSWGHKGGRQYGTLAVDVPCDWTTNDLTKSGCSVATPIMAAVAALVISCVGTYDRCFDPSMRAYVRTHRGIKAVFEEMTTQYSHSSTDRTYIAPWYLLDRGNSPIDLLRSALSKMPPIQMDPTP